MFLFKAFFKVFFKWLLFLFASTENPIKTARNGRCQSKGSSAEFCEKRSDISAEKAIGYFKQAIDEAEANLNRKIERLYEGVNQASPWQPDSVEDMNELRAEIAELKADIRHMRRSLCRNSDPSDENTCSS